MLLASLVAVFGLACSSNVANDLRPQPSGSQLITVEAATTTTTYATLRMALRWTAAGMLEAERQFRKIIGYRDLATLVVAIECNHDSRRHCDAARTPTKEAAIVLTA